MKECGQVPPLGYREIPLTLVQGMAASLIRFSVAVRVRRAEHPLPSGLAVGAGALFGERGAPAPRPREVAAGLSRGYC